MFHMRLISYDIVSLGYSINSMLRRNYLVGSTTYCMIELYDSSTQSRKPELCGRTIERNVKHFLEMAALPANRRGEEVNSPSKCTSPISSSYKAAFFSVGFVIVLGSGAATKQQTAKDRRARWCSMWDRGSISRRLTRPPCVTK